MIYSESRATSKISRSNSAARLSPTLAACWDRAAADHGNAVMPGNSYYYLSVGECKTRGASLRLVTFANILRGQGEVLRLLSRTQSWRKALQIFLDDRKRTLIQGAPGLRYSVMLQHSKARKECSGMAFVRPNPPVGARLGATSTTR